MDNQNPLQPGQVIQPNTSSMNDDSAVDRYIQGAEENILQEMDAESGGNDIPIQMPQPSAIPFEPPQQPPIQPHSPQPQNTELPSYPNRPTQTSHYVPPIPMNQPMAQPPIQPPATTQQIPAPPQQQPTQSPYESPQPQFPRGDFAHPSDAHLRRFPLRQYITLLVGTFIILAAIIILIETTSSKRDDPQTNANKSISSTTQQISDTEDSRTRAVSTPLDSDITLSVVQVDERTVVSWKINKSASYDSYKLHYESGELDRTRSFRLQKDIQIANRDTVEYSITGLSKGIPHDFRLCAFDTQTNSCSVYSPTLTFTP